MNYTKPKDILLSDIRVNAYSAISRNLNSMTSMSISSWDCAIKNAITEGIVEAFETLLDNTYTDQQFEEDIKLK